MRTFEFKECGSTNDEAWKLWGSCAGEPVLVSTKVQTRGRGRQGRPWDSSIEGNLFVSLALAPPKKNLLWLPLAAGIAAYEAIDKACELGEDSLRLKWPNDIMWGNAKLGGILCESRFIGDRPSAVVVGFGLNIEHAPRLEDLETAALRSNIRRAYANNLRLAIMRDWAKRLIDLSDKLSADKTDEVRALWLAYAKLARFHDFRMHDQSGALVAAKAMDLTAEGKLQALLASTGETVLLDQAT